VNHGTEPVAIAAGDRIAQLLVQSVARVRFTRAALAPTGRGAGGVGSTGA
jgi:dUTP pyrophosphatase